MIDVEDKCYICGEKLEPVDGKFNSLMGNKVCNSCWRWNEDSEKGNIPVKQKSELLEDTPAYNYKDSKFSSVMRVFGIILIVLALVLGAIGVGAISNFFRNR